MCVLMSLFWIDKDENEKKIELFFYSKGAIASSTSNWIKKKVSTFIFKLKIKMNDSNLSRQAQNNKVKL